MDNENTVESKKLISIQNIKDFIEVRTKNHIFIYYLLLIIFKNWDILLFLIFDKSEILVKIYFIKDNFNNYLERLIYPALIGFSLLVIIPFASYIIELLTHNFENKRESLTNQKRIFLHTLKVKLLNIQQSNEDRLNQIQKVSTLETKLLFLEKKNVELRKENNELLSRLDLKGSYNSSGNNVKYYNHFNKLFAKFLDKKDNEFLIEEINNFSNVLEEYFEYFSKYEESVQIENYKILIDFLNSEEIYLNNEENFMLNKIHQIIVKLGLFVYNKENNYLEITNFGQDLRKFLKHFS